MNCKEPVAVTRSTFVHGNYTICEHTFFCVQQQKKVKGAPAAAAEKGASHLAVKWRSLTQKELRFT